MRRSNTVLNAAMLSVGAFLGFGVIYAMRHSLLFFVAVFLAGCLLSAGLALASGGRIRDLAVVCASVCLMLVGAEGLALLLDTSIRTHNEGRYTQDYVGFDPVLGAAPAKAGRFDSRKIDERTGGVIYDVAYTIDPNLIRATGSVDTGPAIAFFGDSFMFGEGVQDSETLPQGFADLTGRKLRVLNFGFHGYGPQQFLRSMETGRFDPLLRPALELAVFQTAPWHAERTSCEADFVAGSPRYVLQGGKPAFAGACDGVVGNVFFKLLEKSAVYRLLIQPILAGGPDRADMELYIAVVSGAVREAMARHGAPTVILYLAYDDQYLRRSGFSNDEIVARLRESGAEIVDVTLTGEDGAALKRYDRPTPFIIAGDGHPTALAQRRRAEILYEFLSQQHPEMLAAGEPAAVAPGLARSQSGSNALR